MRGGHSVGTDSSRYVPWAASCFDYCGLLAVLAVLITPTVQYKPTTQHADTHIPRNRS